MGQSTIISNEVRGIGGVGYERAVSHNCSSNKLNLYLLYCVDGIRTESVVDKNNIVPFHERLLFTMLTPNVETSETVLKIGSRRPT